MEKYILDTNLFFNMEAGIGLGQKTEEVIRTITAIAKQLKAQNKAAFYMSPRIVEEIYSFFDDKNQEFLHEFFAEMIIKNPDANAINVSATVLYQLVEDVRLRNYRGISIAEEEMKNVAKAMVGKEESNKKEFEISVGGYIRHFRDRFRQATRFGFLDSVADLDSIMLSKELDGFLVSTDEGVIKWGRIFGVKELPANLFGKKLLEMAK